MTAPSRLDGSGLGPLAFQKRISQETNFSYLGGRLNARFRDFFDVATLDSLEDLALDELERLIQESAYGSAYRQDFLLVSHPTAVRLSRLIVDETSRRLNDLNRWSRGKAALVAALLGLLSDLPLGLDFLRSLTFRHTTAPQKPCFGLLEQSFWRALWDGISDDEQISSLCHSQEAPQADLLHRAVYTTRSEGRLRGELVWIDGLFQLAFQWLEHVGREGSVIKPFVAQWADPWNYRIWSLRHRDESVSDLAFLSVQGQLTFEVLHRARNERALFADTVWSFLRSPEDRNTASDMERDLLSRQAVLNRADPLGAGLMAAYVARQLIEYLELAQALARLSIGNQQ